MGMARRPVSITSRMIFANDSLVGQILTWIRTGVADVVLDGISRRDHTRCR
jgi:hypothetical protein